MKNPFKHILTPEQAENLEEVIQAIFEGFFGKR
jgi:hypothetical protein